MHILFVSVNFEEYIQIQLLHILSYSFREIQGEEYCRTIYTSIPNSIPLQLYYEPLVFFKKTTVFTFFRLLVGAPLETNGQHQTGDVYKCSLSRRTPGPSCTKLNLGTLSPLHIPVVYACRFIYVNTLYRHHNSLLYQCYYFTICLLISGWILELWFWVKCYQAAFGVKSYRGEQSLWFILSSVYIHFHICSCTCHTSVWDSICGHCVCLCGCCIVYRICMLWI